MGRRGGPFTTTSAHFCVSMSRTRGLRSCTRPFCPAPVIPKETEAEIVRLYHGAKWPTGTIAGQLGIHHTTVQRVLRQPGEQAQVDWAHFEDGALQVVVEKDTRHTAEVGECLDVPGHEERHRRARGLGQIRDWPSRERLQELFGARLEIEGIGTCAPRGDLGWLRFVHNGLTRRAAELLMGREGWRNLRERASLGRSIVLVAHRR